MKTLRNGLGCRYASKASAHVFQKPIRHSNIGVTMDFYANVDKAAVLGPQRITSRNTPPVAAEEGKRRDDANPMSRKNLD
jgi:hypothetical protein